MAPGAWRGMDRRDWQQVQDRWMGPEMMSTDDGWSVWQIAAAVGGIGLIPLLAAGLLVVLLRRTTSTPAQP